MLEKIPPELAGFFIAIFLSIARVISDNKHGKRVRVFTESIICGGLSLTVSYAVLAMGLSHFWSAFLGGMIGYLGSETVRQIAIKIISAKLGIKKNEVKNEKANSKSD